MFCSGVADRNTLLEVDIDAQLLAEVVRAATLCWKSTLASSSWPSDAGRITCRLLMASLVFWSGVAGRNSLLDVDIGAQLLTR
ncbi:hypothetical protein EMIT0P201_40037 [Pseudomonas chlororaphis]